MYILLKFYIKTKLLCILRDLYYICFLLSTLYILLTFYRKQNYCPSFRTFIVLLCNIQTLYITNLLYSENITAPHSGHLLYLLTLYIFLSTIREGQIFMILTSKEAVLKDYEAKYILPTTWRGYLYLLCYCVLLL